MNPSLLAGLGVLLVVVIGWRVRFRPGTPLVRQGDTGAVAALNRAQIALAQSGGFRAAGSAGSAPAQGPLPAALGASLEGQGAGGRGLGIPIELLGPPPLGRLAPGPTPRGYLTLLERAFQRGGAARLEAIRLARRWGHRCTLPLLRRGLRCADQIGRAHV